MSSSCFTQPPEFGALTAHLSGARRGGCWNSRLTPRASWERATSAEELQAGVRAWRECEQELLEQLTALLDVALWVVRELAP